MIKGEIKWNKRSFSYSSNDKIIKNFIPMQPINWNLWKCGVVNTNWDMWGSISMQQHLTESPRTEQPSLWTCCQQLEEPWASSLGSPSSVEWRLHILLPRSSIKCWDLRKIIQENEFHEFVSFVYSSWNLLLKISRERKISRENKHLLKLYMFCINHFALTDISSCGWGLPVCLIL